MDSRAEPEKECIVISEDEYAKLNQNIEQLNRENQQLSTENTELQKHIQELQLKNSKLHLEQSDLRSECKHIALEKDQLETMLSDSYKEQSDQLDNIGGLSKDLTDAQDATKSLERDYKRQQDELLKKDQLIKEQSRQIEQLTTINRALTYAKSYAKAVGSKSVFFSEASTQPTTCDEAINNRASCTRK